MARRQRPYQGPAMVWCRGKTIHQRNPALFMEMRLGKTLIIIRVLRWYKPRGEKLRALIVAPNETMESWQDELDAEGVTDYVFLNEGTKEKRNKLLEEDHSWNIMNPEAWDALQQIKNIPWDAVVCDESTFLKNPKANVTQFFLKNFRDDRIHRWVSVGIPNPENDLEYFCQLQFAHGSAFGQRNYWNFRAQYYQEGGYHDWNPKLGTLTYVKGYVSKYAYVLRRVDALGKEPTKVFEKLMLDLPPELRKAYKVLEDEFILEWEGQTVKSSRYAPVAYQQIRRLCSGFVDKECKWEGKYDLLLSLLKGELSREESVLVWFKYNIELHYAYKKLRGEGITTDYMVGANRKDRPAILKRFRSGKTRVLLLQTQVARRGMDLAKADTSIYFSLPAGSNTWLQSQDRILHVDKKNPLLIISLLTRDSVEDDYYERLTQRDSRVRWDLGRVVAMAKKRRGEI